MDQNLAMDIARQIVNEGLLSNWKFYGLLVAIGIVYVAAAGFSWPYFARRGEVYATRADFQEILSQLEKTTETVEKVKTEVQRSDWTWRELQTLRRTKLEELMTLAHSTFDWLSAERSHVVFGSTPNLAQEPASRTRMLASLYFPELMIDAHTVGMRFLECRSAIFAAGIAIGKVAFEGGEIPVVRDSELTKIIDLQKLVLAATSALEIKAQDLMTKITHVRSGDNKGR